MLPLSAGDSEVIQMNTRKVNRPMLKTFYLTEECAEWLIRQSCQREISESWIIRDLIKTEIAKEKEAKKRV